MNYELDYLSKKNNNINFFKRRINDVHFIYPISFPCPTYRKLK